MEINEIIEKLDTSSDKAAAKVINDLTKIGTSAVPHLLKAAKIALKLLGE